MGAGAAGRRGRVVGADGRPVAGARVAVTWSTAPAPEIGMVTDAAGRFRVGLPPGRFRLEAFAADGRRGEATIDGGPGPEIVLRIGERTA